MKRLTISQTTSFTLLAPRSKLPVENLERSTAMEVTSGVDELRLRFYAPVQFQVFLAEGIPAEFCTDTVGENLARRVTPRRRLEKRRDAGLNGIHGGLADKCSIPIAEKFPRPGIGGHYPRADLQRFKNGQSEIFRKGRQEKQVGSLQVTPLALPPHSPKPINSR